MDATQDEDDEARSTRTEVRELGRVLRGQKARGAAAALLQPARPELVFNAAALHQVDAFGAVFLRAAIDQHLAHDPSHSVSLVEPADPDVFSVLYDLLGGLTLPSRCSWRGSVAAPRRGDRVLVPAGPLTSPHDVDSVVDIALPSALAALGHPRRIARVAQEAAAVFVDNVAQHGDGLPTLCAHFDADNCIVQVVVFDRGPFRTEGGGPLHDVVTGIREGHGGLSELCSQRYNGVSHRVRLGWGTERASYHGHDHRWRDATVKEVLPGFASAAEIEC